MCLPYAFALSGGVWYLSSSGSDTVLCGMTASTACKTLEGILEQLPAQLVQEPLELNLQTDTNITLGADLLVRSTLLTTHVCVVLPKLV